MDDDATKAFQAFDEGLQKGREEGRDDERRRIIKLLRMMQIEDDMEYIINAIEGVDE